jgi:parallel beta-helix repeat protein
MTRNLALSVTLIANLFASFLFAATIHVPADQPTIQAGINAAGNGDMVLVAPGTYKENINFQGKAITVKSSGGAKVTIIDGGGVAPVVTFSSNETSSSVLNGFTLQNGTSTFNSQYAGGGIFMRFASPTIKNNTIQNNTACAGGAGIEVYFGSPVIQGNIIRNNSQSGCSGGGGGGIEAGGASTAHIIGNVIQNNSWGGSGGGIFLDAVGSALIENNVITGNAGGGITMINDVSGTAIVQNLISGNVSTGGSGVYWSNPPAIFVNNTIIDSTASGGSTVATDDFGTPVTVANNIIIAIHGATNALSCVTDILDPSTFYNNDIFSANGPAYGGLCTAQTGTRGNISANPKFAGTSNFRLKGGSPAIDVGNNSAPDLPSTDIAGNRRINNGNGGATAIVDMGAYEFVPVVLAPKSLAFGLQAVDSTTSKAVKLTNAQNKILNISSYSAPTGYSVSGCGSSIAAFTSCTLTATFHPLTRGTFKGSLIVTDDAGNSPQTVSLSGSAQ